MAVVAAVAAAGLGGLYAFSGGSPPSEADAPPFTAPGTDGKPHSLKGLTENGPAVLYFIKEGCPVNHDAAPLMSKLSGAYENKVNLVGVYNGSVAEAKSWAKRYGAGYVILADPQLKIIRSFRVPYSPYLISVEKGAKYGSLRGDGTAKNMEAANKLLASGAGKKLVAVSFKGAPEGGG